MNTPPGAALVYVGQTIQIYDPTLTTNRNVAASGEAAGRGSARALRPREIDYARTSDDDIFSM
ncbi:MAG: hypothetical protein WBF35_00830, partial [Candidatus Acidiferrales bacterium]